MNKTMIKIAVNGEPKEIREASNVSELLDVLGLTGKFVAVELNKQIVSFRNYRETILQNGDALEIVTLVGGG